MRFLTERGQNVNGQPNIIYVSMDNGIVWTPLHEFLDVCVCVHTLTTASSTSVRSACLTSYVLINTSYLLT